MKEIISTIVVVAFSFALAFAMRAVYRNLRYIYILKKRARRNAPVRILHYLNTTEGGLSYGK